MRPHTVTDRSFLLPVLLLACAFPLVGRGAGGADLRTGPAARPTATDDRPSPVTAHEAEGAGQGSLLTHDSGGALVAMPLRHTDVRAEVSGFLARVEVTQTFGNPFDRPIEATYVFPLPDKAAVDDMLIEIGDRRIRGEIHRREEARRIYETARAAGYATALLEQERPNIFTQSVANIEPGGEIKVRIRYVERLPYEAGTYTFNFPMVVGPRYRPGGPGGGGPDDDAAGGSDDDMASPHGALRPEEATAGAVSIGNAASGLVPSSAAAGRPEGRTNPSVLRPGLRTAHDISLTVQIDAGVPLRGLKSPSHEIDITWAGARRATVSLDARDAIPNKDFILRYDVAGELPEIGVLAHRESGDGFFALVLQPKAEVSERDAAPKEIIFVLDTSGSMSGLPIDMSKRLMREALTHLGPDDTFNIIEFAGRASMMAPAPLANTRENVERALRVVEEASGEGGTEMLKGFQAAFLQPHDPGRIRIVMFLTDGYIGNEWQILSAVQEKVGEARIFTLGVGSSVNHYLLSRMAALGRGSYQYIRPDGNEAEAVERFYSWVTRPYLTDLDIDWGGLQVADLVPEQLPDLYSGQTLALVGRYLWGGSATVIVRGRLGGRPWEQHVTVSLPEQEARNDSLASVWARHRIDTLMMSQQSGTKPEIRAEVLALALQYRLMSAYTSFVAVDDSAVVSPGGPARTVPQAVPIPQSVSFKGIFGSDGPIALRGGRVGTADLGSDRDQRPDPGAPDSPGPLEAAPRSGSIGEAEARKAHAVTVRQARLADSGNDGEVRFAAAGETGKVTLSFSDSFVEDLPVVGRSYTTVLHLAPGVADSSGDGAPVAVELVKVKGEMIVEMDEGSEMKAVLGAAGGANGGAPGGVGGSVPGGVVGGVEGGAAGGAPGGAAGGTAGGAPGGSIGGIAGGVVGGVVGGVLGGVVGGVAAGAPAETVNAATPPPAGPPPAAGPVQGGRERDVKATVDGVSNVDPLTGTFMSNVNPDAIEDVEVVTSGAGAVYGGAVGGFARVITKQAATDGRTRQASYPASARRLLTMQDSRVVENAFRVLADLADDGRLTSSDGRPALAALLAVQYPSGAMAVTVQAHALATWALVEAAACRRCGLYAQDRAWVDGAAGRAIEHLARTRLTSGAWPFVRGGGPDRAATGWAAIAIAAAGASGRAGLPPLPDPSVVSKTDPPRSATDRSASAANSAVTSADPLHSAAANAGPHAVADDNRAGSPLPRETTARGDAIAAGSPAAPVSSTTQRPAAGGTATKAPAGSASAMAGSATPGGPDAAGRALRALLAMLAARDNPERLAVLRGIAGRRAVEVLAVWPIYLFRLEATLGGMGKGAHASEGAALSSTRGTGQRLSPEVRLLESAPDRHLKLTRSLLARN